MLLGLLSFIPLLCTIALMLSMFILAFVDLTGGDEDAFMLYILPLFVLITLLIPLLIIFYILHAINNQKIRGQKKVLWILFLFSGNIISIPVYFYQFIWKTRG